MKLPLARQLRIGLMAAILCVTSQWTIPVGAVPMTLQTFFIALCGAVLGPWHGALAAVVYLLLGACGLPVFSGFMGGVGRLVGPTGGFLWTFPALAALCGLASNRGYIWQLGSSLAGLGALYAAGTLQLMAVANLSFAAALTAAVLPFAAKDVLCVAGAVALGRLMKGRIERHA